MKKIIIIVIVLLLIGLGILFMLYKIGAFTNSTPVSGKVFTSKMEQMGYKVDTGSDVKNGILKMYIASICAEKSHNPDTIHIEFYEMADEKSAKSFYYYIRKDFDQNLIPSNINIITGIFGNMQYYERINNQTSGVVVRIGATIVCSEFYFGHADRIKQALKEIGYYYGL